MIIDNLEYSPDLENKNSSTYKVLAQSLEEQIKASIFSRDMLLHGPADIEVKIMEFS